jgi:hypothetical protein
MFRAYLLWVSGTNWYSSCPGDPQILACDVILWLEWPLSQLQVVDNWLLDRVLVLHDGAEHKEIALSQRIKNVKSKAKILLVQTLINNLALGRYSRPK